MSIAPSEGPGNARNVEETEKKKLNVTTPNPSDNSVWFSVHWAFYEAVFKVRKDL
jgi:hypothetical protein